MEDASTSVNWLQKILGLMGYTASVNTNFKEESLNVASNSQNFWLEISTEGLQEQQIQRLIGQDGVVIDSLQYLANTILNNHIPSDTNQSENHRQNHNFYTVELNGYRSKHLASLHELAENAVQKVRETKAELALKHLSSADRRYIHQLLESFPDIETYSQGKEPNRHLIVKLV